MFKDPETTAIITTARIMNRMEPILSVWHDEEDGMWQFLGESGPDESDAVIVGLQEIVKLDHSVNEVATLPLGWVAWREKKGLPWNIQKQLG
ncbi:MAG: hypothetical protein FWF59_01510 [Turicibacter sp.]|nr:hypothetical protein [Turicibacter sp.]